MNESIITPWRIRLAAILLFILIALFCWYCFVNPNHSTRNKLPDGIPSHAIPITPPASHPILKPTRPPSSDQSSVEQGREVISGFVRDTDGIRIQGVIVSIERSDQFSIQERFQIKTDANGEFVFENLSGGDYHLTLSRDGVMDVPSEGSTSDSYVYSGESRHVVPAGTVNYEILLEPEIELDVTVKYKTDGTVVQDYSIQLGTFRRSNPLNSGQRHIDVESSTGFARIFHVPLGRISIEIFRDFADLRAVRMAERTIYVKDHLHPSKVEFLIDKEPQILMGYVFGHDRNDPLDKATVQMEPQLGLSLNPMADPNDHFLCTTDKTGRFRIGNMTPGEYSVSISGQTGANWFAFGEKISIDESTRSIEFIIGSRLHDFWGRVIDKKSHEGISSANIQLVPTVLNLTNVTERTWVTDENGAFMIPNLASGIRFIEVSHADYASARTDPIDTATGNDPAKPYLIEMSRGCLLEGSVYDWTRKPLPNKNVQATEFRLESDSGLPNRQFSIFALSAQTDTNGCFSFPNLPGGPLLLEVELEGSVEFPMQMMTDILIEIGSNEKQVMRFDVDKGVTVDGRLICENEPVPDTMIIVFSNPDRTVITKRRFQAVSVTRSDGSFRFEHILPGHVTFSSDLSDATWQREIPERDVEIILEAISIDQEQEE